jgi:simple sugar transport system permease protein
MVGYYAGLAAVAAMSVFWLTAPYHAPELIYPLGGQGLKQTIPLEGHFEKILDRWWGIGSDPGKPQGPPARSTPIPYGLLLVWLLAAAALWGFLKTRAGIALGIAGANPRFAHLAGVEVRAIRRLSVVLSTAIAALGIIVFTQSLGLVQLYKAPVGNTLPAVAAVLIGGATLRRATVLHALIGVAMFQLLLVISPPVVNDLVQRYAAGHENLQSLENLPEILRVLILNGFILYALASGGKEESW